MNRKAGCHDGGRVARQSGVDSGKSDDLADPCMNKPRSTFLDPRGLGEPRLSHSRALIPLKGSRQIRPEAWQPCGNWHPIPWFVLQHQIGPDAVFQWREQVRAPCPCPGSKLSRTRTSEQLNLGCDGGVSVDDGRTWPIPLTPTVNLSVFGEGAVLHELGRLNADPNPTPRRESSRIRTIRVISPKPMQNGA